MDEPRGIEAEEVRVKTRLREDVVRIVRNAKSISPKDLWKKLGLEGSPGAGGYWETIASIVIVQLLEEEQIVLSEDGQTFMSPEHAMFGHSFSGDSEE